MKKRKILILVTFLTIVSCIIFIFIGTKSIQKLNIEKEKIKKTVIGALKIDQLIIFPAEYTKSPDIQIPKEVVDKKLKEVEQACEKYLSKKSGWFANRLKVYQKAVLAEAYPSSDIRAVELKISDIKFLKIKVKGKKAAVVVDIFGEYMSVMNKGHIAHNYIKVGERHYFDLEKENGDWKITSETFNFLPGYEP
ncbi:hypothetical protein [Anaerocellum danielii]|uniref:Lipoprotein n=1 Tax=Anaerocellum danielii TaxID=1387557 RepID=A0ABZ0TYI4_9FIRM|nr:hypothetical protein [Caldicellulosiruptor danielii]WPX08470.1 hypothetical protein SOJ16_002360 [Caldicellulosiruptor danielii]